MQKLRITILSTVAYINLSNQSVYETSIHKNYRNLYILGSQITIFHLLAHASIDYLIKFTLSVA